jgi:hypothetical protein
VTGVRVAASTIPAKSSAIAGVGELSARSAGASMARSTAAAWSRWVSETASAGAA